MRRGGAGYRRSMSSYVSPAAAAPPHLRGALPQGRTSNPQSDNVVKIIWSRFRDSAARGTGLDVAGRHAVLGQAVEGHPDVGGLGRGICERDRPAEPDAGLVGAPEPPEQRAPQPQEVAIARKP